MPGSPMPGRQKERRDYTGGLTEEDEGVRQSFAKASGRKMVTV